MKTKLLFVFSTLILLALNPAFAQNAFKNLKLNSYEYVNSKNIKITKTILFSGRPDILDVPPAKVRFQSLGKEKNWNLYEEAYLYLLAQIMSAFPDGEYYFLARDIEYLYDVSRIIFKDDPEMLKRFHLIPVGRGITQNELLDKYLSQEGLTTAKLKGRTPVFVDSCCSGSIPKLLKGKVGPKGIKGAGFLIDSGALPQSKLFSRLVRSNSGGGAIEGHPHFTGSAQAIARIDSKYEIIMSKNAESEPDLAIKGMKSIRKYYDDDERREQFFEVLENMNVILSFLRSQNQISVEQATVALDSLQNDFNLPISTLLTDILSINRENNVKKISLSKLSKLFDSPILAGQLEFIADFLAKAPLEKDGKISDFALTAVAQVFSDEALQIGFKYPVDVTSAGAKKEYRENVSSTVYSKLLSSLTSATDMEYTGEVFRVLGQVSAVSDLELNLRAWMPSRGLTAAQIKLGVSEALIGSECQYVEGSILYQVATGKTHDMRGLLDWLRICVPEMEEKEVKGLLAKILESFDRPLVVGETPYGQPIKVLQYLNKYISKYSASLFQRLVKDSYSFEQSEQILFLIENYEKLSQVSRAKNIELNDQTIERLKLKNIGNEKTKSLKWIYEHYVDCEKALLAG